MPKALQAKEQPRDEVPQLPAACTVGTFKEAEPSKRAPANIDLRTGLPIFADISGIFILLGSPLEKH